ncbi:hypothetical protein TUM4261_36390 [Shewanella sp. c952]|nr:hypothetical protein TUM4261_36390 [Shewanella sp. c952]
MPVSLEVEIGLPLAVHLVGDERLKLQLYRLYFANSMLITGDINHYSYQSWVGITLPYLFVLSRFV